MKKVSLCATISTQVEPGSSLEESNNKPASQAVANDEYELYGEDWKNYMVKLPKAVIVQFAADLGKTNQILKEKLLSGEKLSEEELEREVKESSKIFILQRSRQQGKKYLQETLSSKSAPQEKDGE